MTCWRSLILDFGSESVSTLNARAPPFCGYGSSRMWKLWFIEYWSIQNMAFEEKTMIRFKKKQKMSFQGLALVTLVAFAWFVLPSHRAIAQAVVQLPAGTMILLATDSTLAPAQLNIGDIVQLTVAADVVIDGQVVIKAGAEAVGEITASKENNLIGIAAKMGLAIRSVQAVDGTIVPLHGTKLVEGKDKMALSIGLSLLCCVLFALMKGGEATIASGTQIEATIATMTPIEVR